MNYFIYVFLDKKNRPYYVGKTNNVKRRREEHVEAIKSGNTLPKYSKTRRIINSGGKFHMRSIERVFDEREAYRIERKYIKKYRKANYILTNLTYGGPKELPMKLNKPAKENQKGLVFKKTKAKAKTKVKKETMYKRIWTHENRCLLFRKIKEKFGAYSDWPTGSNTCPAGLGKEYKEYIRETINTEQIKELNRDIEICYNAKKLMETPVDVTFYNMGTNINSRRADYNPHIAADGHIMVFASNKKYIKDYQQYVKNCYMSFPVKDDFGEWSKARSFGSKVNTEENEDVVALSHDGTKAIVHLDNFVAGDDIGVSTKRTTRFREVIVFNKEINSKYLEEGACFSPSMDTLFFASDRPEGLGGFDIYYCTRISKEEWTMPVNMGISINTKYDENFPEMSHDGTKLRLASKGYNTMGGYDIFECEWIKEEYKWGKPKNMGYPVNDTYDNTNISITKNGRYGYMPKWRKEGVGGLDIYKVIFNDVPATKIKYHGIIAIGDSIYPKQIADISSDIRMKIFDKRTKDEIADLTEMAKQAKYEIELVPGTYVLVIKGNAYETYQMDIIIYEEQAIITDYKIDIYLTEKINNQ